SRVQAAASCKLQLTDYWKITNGSDARAAARANKAAYPAHKETDMEMDMNDQLETKAGIPHDAVVTHGEMLRAFEEFKLANDEQLRERRGSRDVLTEEKIARIDATLDQHKRLIDETTLKS